MHLDLSTPLETRRKPMHPATEAHETGSGQVLVVDDCPIIRDLLCLALEHEGFTARTAADGSEALKLLECQRPDVIVCDLHMPGMDGLALLRRLRESPQWARVPLVLLTVESRGAASDAARAAGASAFMSKPFQARDVAAVVKRLAADTKAPASRRAA